MIGIIFVSGALMILFMIPVIFTLITKYDVESEVLMIFIALVMWYVLYKIISTIWTKITGKQVCIPYGIDYDGHAYIEKRGGVLDLPIEEKKIRKEVYEKRYKEICQEAQQTPEQRYAINYDIIKDAFNLAKGLAVNKIQQGIDMQNSKGPQVDPYIVGGLTSGVAGGVAGMAAAVDTMRKNAEKTEKYHRRGKELVEEGIESYKTFEKDEEAIFSQTYDDFTYSIQDANLVDQLTVELKATYNYGIGYICADVKIVAARDYIFPGTTKLAVIDGSVRIDVYDKDGVNLIASGYCCAPGRFGDDRSKTGFGLSEYRMVILREEPGVSFNKYDEHQIKLSNPNLWLLQL